MITNFLFISEYNIAMQIHTFLELINSELGKHYH